MTAVTPIKNSPSDEFNFESMPNPAKLIESMRHLGYDNYSALADILDNSLDAEATHIQIAIRQKNGQPEIIIADDGNGMNADILGQAIRLGSETTKNAESDLGKFGMGLCTASLSICRELIILTKDESGKLLKAVNDIDVVIAKRAFVSYLGEPEATDIALYKEFLGSAETGTLVVLRNCDNIVNSNTTNFANTLKKEFGRIFRHFIDAGIKITVNGAEIRANDPLEWKDEKTERYDEGTIDIEVVGADGKKCIEKINVKLAILKSDEERGEKERDLNQRSQGLYIMRNNREMLAANTLGLFVKHNSLNRFRGELSFSGNLDKLFGINFTKKNVALQQALSDKLKEYLGPQIASIRGRETKRTRKETPENINEIHLDAAKEINKKSKLLMRPKADKEKREEGPGASGKKTPSAGTGRTREPGDNKQEGFTANCEFKAAAMGISGAIFDAEQQGRKVIVTYNSDHPFYQKFILGYGETDRGLVAGIDYLIYSLACAELKQNIDEPEVMELITSFKGIMASNLRVLLS